MSTKPLFPRRTSIESIDSVESSDTFDGEMDEFIQLLKKKKATYPPSKKEELEEDNISEEKVKQELNENEKGGRNNSPDIRCSESLDGDQSKIPHHDRSKTPDHDRAKTPGHDHSKTLNHDQSESPRYETSPINSPEPEITVRDARKTLSEITGSKVRSGMDRDSEHIASQQSDDDYSVDEGAHKFELTDDMTDEQRRAILELQQMRLDLPEVGLNDEEPPEYDVKDRLRQLNEELAADPTPLDDERQRSIKFKDNLVDLVAPPPDYLSDEGEGTVPASHPDAANESGDADEKVAELNLNQMNLNGAENEGGGDTAMRRVGGVDFDVIDADVEQTVRSSGDDGHGRHIPPVAPVSYGDGNVGSEDDNVLVQRGNTYELIKASELTAEERDMYLPPSDDSEDNDMDSGTLLEPIPPSTSPSGTAPADSSFQPTPPREPRPSTAAGGHPRRPMATPPRRRAHSATPARKTNQGNALLNYSYCSPYAQDDELKKLGERQRKNKAERERKEKEIAKMEDDRKQQMNEDAFMAWVDIKRKSGAWRREKTDDEQTIARRKAEKDKEGEAAFAEWIKAKRVQQRREKQVEERRKEEEEQGWYDRPRQECDKAFRQWLKKKNVETKKAKKQEVARQRINKLLIRRTRKAMQLVRAIRQSQTFRYVDYYGYRF